MKKLPAIIAALVTSVVMVCLMLAVAVNALMNPNVVQAADVPGQVVAASPANSSKAGPAAQVAVSTNDPQAQIQQLQSLVAQYQAREKQYQDREKQLQSQINQLNQVAQNATAQVQQYQSLLQQLQQMGVIRVDQSGNVSVPRFSRGFGDDH